MAMTSSPFVVASLLVVVLTLAGQTFAADLIELNDANKNQLNLEVGKALEVVQGALTNGFKFGLVKDAKNFVTKCKYLKRAMESENDDAFQGLAGKIKSLLQDEQLKVRCHIELEKFDQYAAQLDKKEVGSFYLSKKRLEGLIALGEKLDQDPTMKLVLGDLYAEKTVETGEQLLQHAAEDTSIFFGELDESRFLVTRYHSGCAISSVKPICKLVRGVSEDNVSAYGKDVAQFSQLLKADQSVVAQRVQASGVSLDQLRAQCKACDFSLHPIQQVNKCLKAGYLDVAQIDARKVSDSVFDFYYELNNLCSGLHLSSSS